MHTQFEKDPRSWYERELWVREFEERDVRRAVFGCNDWAFSIGQQLAVEYFIDDFVQTDVFAGSPVRRSDEADTSVMTLSAVVGIRPLTARRHLSRIVKSSLDYYSYSRFSSLEIKPIFGSGNSGRLQVDPSHLEELEDRLFDEQSKDVFRRIVALRRDLDIDAMVVFRDNQSDQYFEPFIRLAPGDVFLDVGAFDGQTTQHALGIQEGLSKCILIEPNQKSSALLKEVFGNDSRIEIYEVALSDQTTELELSDRGSASKIGVGSQSVQGAPLDSLGLDRLDFVKVDVEGWEEKFLEGATATLSRTQPQLAIACYHSNEQFTEVFDMCRRILPDARIYMRHYTEGFAETDLFFVPPRFW